MTMRRTGLSLAVGVFLFASSAAAQADPTPPAPKSTLPPQLFAQPPNTPFPDGARIAFINIQLIAQESAVGKAASEQINKLRGVKLADLDSKTKALKTLQGKQTASIGVLNKAAAERLQQEIDRAEMEVQYSKQTAERELTNLTDELMADFSNKVRPVVEGIRAERQLWAVFLMDENLVAMMPGLDVSAEVIKRLDVKK
jgi:Skp family chaperone for outer membrane proteins